ncbi:AAA family ATPase [Fusibacter bizertensis]
MTPINAIVYLEQKKTFEDDAYEWINPLIKVCLAGCKITNELLISHIDGKIESSYVPRDESENGNFFIHRIKEISEMKNVGLIEIEKEPLLLKDGLNIFYGKNGSGKSTIYKSLVNSLGNKHVKSEPNIHNGDKTVSVKVKIEDRDGAEAIVNYTGKEQFETNVKVYDTRKMDILIKPKREQFEIPILNQEVFNHIRDLFDQYSTLLDKKIGENTRRQTEISRTFEDRFDLLRIDTKEIEKILKENNFTEDDEKFLSLKQSEMGELSVYKIELEKRALAIANKHIYDIICMYGSIDETEDKSIFEFKNIKSEFENYSRNQIEFKKLEELIELNSIEGFKSYIDESWIGNKKWKSFIISGLDFVSTLEEETEQCPYCHQSLSDAAKALLEKYKSLKSDAEKTIMINKTSIENTRKHFKVHQDNIKACSELITKLIHLDGYEFDKEFTIGITEGEIEAVLIKMDNKESITADEIKFIEILETQLKAIFKVYQSNNASIKIKEESIKSVEDDKKEIQNAIDELEKRKLIKDRKALLEEYIELAKTIIKYNTQRTQLTALKTKNSVAQANFSNESYIKMYQEQISKEYEALEQRQIIKPVYKPQKNECICSIESTNGSYNISDIFSEGEIRIHSLAELFAEATLTDYKGVYIFDDPVNSLDETNIDYVAKRILKLVEAGNQVIIFTHNILFLNELVEVEKESIINVEKFQYGYKPEEATIIIENQAFNEKTLKIRKERIENTMKDIEVLRGNADLVEMRGRIAYMYSELSGYLEDYFEKKIIDGIITRHRNNIRMHSVINLKDINKDGQLDSLNELYEKTSKFCNRHSQTLSQKKADYQDIMIDYPVFRTFVGWK